MEDWNIGCNLQPLKRILQPSFQYSSIPLIPPPPLRIEGLGGLKLGCITQIGFDDLGMILNNLRATLCNPLPEI